MKNLILSLLCFVLGLSCLAQQPTSASRSWQLLSEDANTRFEFTDKTVEDRSKGINHCYRLIRVVNKTDQRLSLKWFQETHYNQNCTNCDKKEEYTFSTEIQGGQTIEGDINSDSQFLKVFVLDHEGWVTTKLTELAIRNINYTDAR